nr:cupin domain-containing protein [Haloglomus sp. DT116]
MDPVNAADLEWTETEEGATHFRRKQLAAAAGGERIGTSLYELPPGARSWPLHYHRGNEEAFFVLAGEGRLRTDETDDAEDGHPVEAGDYVACPADERGAHQLVNTGEAPLRFLAVSTMHEPDVAVYPESGTVGTFVGRAPGGEGDASPAFYREADAVGYWDDDGPGGRHAAGSEGEDTERRAADGDEPDDGDREA